jgi:hypothetical protein
VCVRVYATGAGGESVSVGVCMGVCMGGGIRLCMLVCTCREHHIYLYHTRACTFLLTS